MLKECGPLSPHTFPSGHPLSTHISRRNHPRTRTCCSRMIPPAHAPSPLHTFPPVHTFPSSHLLLEDVIEAGRPLAAAEACRVRAVVHHEGDAARVHVRVERVNGLQRGKKGRGVRGMRGERVAAKSSCVSARGGLVGWLVGTQDCSNDKVTL